MKQKQAKEETMRKESKTNGPIERKAIGRQRDEARNDRVL